MMSDAEWLADLRARTTADQAWMPGAVGSENYHRLLLLAERALEAEEEVKRLTKERDTALMAWAETEEAATSIVWSHGVLLRVVQERIRGSR